MLYSLPVIRSGATYRLSMTWRNPDSTPVNLTGCVPAMKFKDSSNNLLFDLAAEGCLSIVAATGVIDIDLTAAQTAGLAFSNARFDLLMTMSNGDVLQLLAGTVSTAAVVSL